MKYNKSVVFKHGPLLIYATLTHNKDFSEVEFEFIEKATLFVDDTSIDVTEPVLLNIPLHDKIGQQAVNFLSEFYDGDKD